MTNATAYCHSSRNSNQTPGLTFTLTGGTNSVTESGAGDTLSIVLDTLLLCDVTLSLTSSDTGEFVSFTFQAQLFLVLVIIVHHRQSQL